MSALLIILERLMSFFIEIQKKIKSRNNLRFSHTSEVFMERASDIVMSLTTLAGFAWNTLTHLTHTISLSLFPLSFSYTHTYTLKAVSHSHTHIYKSPSDRYPKMSCCLPSYRTARRNKDLVRSSCGSVRKGFFILFLGIESDRTHETSNWCMRKKEALICKWACTRFFPHAYKFPQLSKEFPST